MAKPKRTGDVASQAKRKPVARRTSQSKALEQVRVYRVVSSVLQVKLSDELMRDLQNNPHWRKRDDIVTNLDFDPPELETRYAQAFEKSGAHGIELKYKTSRSEWDKEQAAKARG